MDEIEFTLNGETFTINQGTYDESYYWSNGPEESFPFATATEAQQDAMRYVRERDAEAEAAADEEDARYGTDRQQVNAEYFATRF